MPSSELGAGRLPTESSKDSRGERSCVRKMFCIAVDVELALCLHGAGRQGLWEGWWSEYWVLAAGPGAATSLCRAR